MKQRVRTDVKKTLLYGQRHVTMTARQLQDGGKRAIFGGETVTVLADGVRLAGDEKDVSDRRGESGRRRKERGRERERGRGRRGESGRERRHSSFGLKKQRDEEKKVNSKQEGQLHLVFKSERDKGQE